MDCEPPPDFVIQAGETRTPIAIGGGVRGALCHLMAEPSTRLCVRAFISLNYLKFESICKE
jgi:hypothetical protein